MRQPPRAAFERCEERSRNGKADETAFKTACRQLETLPFVAPTARSPFSNSLITCAGRDWEPLGILADFIEVDTRYEAIVENFLRPELQYVVVKDRAQASAALAIVKEVTKGRLECLVLNGETPMMAPDVIEEATPLFGRRAL